MSRVSAAVAPEERKHIITALDQLPPRELRWYQEMNTAWVERRDAEAAKRYAQLLIIATRAEFVEPFITLAAMASEPEHRDKPHWRRLRMDSRLAVALLQPGHLSKWRALAEAAEGCKGLVDSWREVAVDALVRSAALAPLHLRWEEAVRAARLCMEEEGWNTAASARTLKRCLELAQNSLQRAAALLAAAKATGGGVSKEGSEVLQRYNALQVAAHRTWVGLWQCRMRLRWDVLPSQATLPLQGVISTDPTAPEQAALAREVLLAPLLATSHSIQTRQSVPPGLLAWAAEVLAEAASLAIRVLYRVEAFDDIVSLGQDVGAVLESVADEADCGLSALATHQLTLATLAGLPTPPTPLLSTLQGLPDQMDVLLPPATLQYLQSPQRCLHARVRTPDYLWQEREALDVVDLLTHAVRLARQHHTHLPGLLDVPGKVFLTALKAGWVTCFPGHTGLLQGFILHQASDAGQWHPCPPAPPGGDVQSLLVAHLPSGDHAWNLMPLLLDTMARQAGTPLLPALVKWAGSLLPALTHAVALARRSAIPLWDVQVAFFLAQRAAILGDDEALSQLGTVFWRLLAQRPGSATVSRDGVLAYTFATPAHAQAVHDLLLAFHRVEVQKAPPGLPDGPFQAVLAAAKGVLGHAHPKLLAGTGGPVDGGGTLPSLPPASPPTQRRREPAAPSPASSASESDFVPDSQSSGSDSDADLDGADPDAVMGKLLSQAKGAAAAARKAARKARMQLARRAGVGKSAARIGTRTGAKAPQHSSTTRAVQAVSQLFVEGRLAPSLASLHSFYLAARDALLMPWCHPLAQRVMQLSLLGSRPIALACAHAAAQGKSMYDVSVAECLGTPAPPLVQHGRIVRDAAISRVSVPLLMFAWLRGTRGPSALPLLTHIQDTWRAQVGTLLPPALAGDPAVMLRLHHPFLALQEAAACLRCIGSRKTGFRHASFLRGTAAMHVYRLTRLQHLTAPGADAPPAHAFVEVAYNMGLWFHTVSFFPSAVLWYSRALHRAREAGLDGRAPAGWPARRAAVALSILLTHHAESTCVPEATKPALRAFLSLGPPPDAAAAPPSTGRGVLSRW